ncbi:MAG: STAS domain-containing protein [Pseudomonadota bacterium]
MPDNDLHLPEHFDGSHVRQVADELLKRRGQSLELNASRVKTAGTLGLQVLVATAKQWAQDDARFRLIAASDALTQAVDAIGMSRNDIGLAEGKVAS